MAGLNSCSVPPQPDQQDSCPAGSNGGKDPWLHADAPPVAVQRGSSGVRHSAAQLTRSVKIPSRLHRHNVISTGMVQ